MSFREEKHECCLEISRYIVMCCIKFSERRSTFILFKNICHMKVVRLFWLRQKSYSESTLDAHGYCVNVLHHVNIFPAGLYLLKVNNRRTRTRYEICSKSIIRTPERRHWRRFGAFIVNFGHISHLVLMLLLLTLNM